LSIVVISGRKNEDLLDPTFFSKKTMNQFKTLFIFVLFALMITGVVSRPAFLRTGDFSVADDCPVPLCGEVCCEVPKECYR